MRAIALKPSDSAARFTGCNDILFFVILGLAPQALFCRLLRRLAAR
jgi:hypothetical protein